ncbi:MAG: DUF6364 family protein [Prevotellaceae bacterium]|jgi:hypothetical protein|nr:DUF6364 family protein [Prevotellaceae bacterium]
MNTKLTLSIEKNVAKAIKEYAYSNDKTLSEMIENYFQLILHNRIPKPASTPIVNSLKGSFKIPDDFDYKEALSDALVEKQQFFHWLSNGK